jgi:glycosyltransferase involved in cell wall biosynthesis
MSDTPLCVCLIAPLPPPYGGISHWSAMICRYAGVRKDIKLFTVNTAVRWRVIHDQAIWKRTLGGGLQLMRDILIFCGTLLVHRPNVVHLTTSGQLSIVRDRWVMFVAALFHVPVIYHIRFGRVPQISGENSREWRFMARAMKKAHTVVVIDTATENAIRRCLPNVRLKRIPNCVNTEGLPEQKDNVSPVRTALFIGWVIATKGIGELIDAWTQLQPAGWRLVIVGPGDLAYQQQVLDTFRPKTVEFIGELSHEETMKQLRLADIFVLPSYTEGFPNVVLEAMALGKAIVATDVGAIPEMLADGCGILVKPRDVVGLATALRRLIADEQQWAIMGERARTRALATFSLKSAFATYMSVWRQAAGLLEQETSGEINQ